MATWYTAGTCSRKIDFEVEKDTVKEVIFEGGCPGNLLGISNIVKDMQIDDVIERFKGIKCGYKETSCPDQLAMALISWKEENSK